MKPPGSTPFKWTTQRLRRHSPRPREKASPLFPNPKGPYSFKASPHVCYRSLGALSTSCTASAAPLHLLLLRRCYYCCLPSAAATPPRLLLPSSVDWVRRSPSFRRFVQRFSRLCLPRVSPRPDGRGGARLPPARPGPHAIDRLVPRERFYLLDILSILSGKFLSHSHAPDSFYSVA